ncbi:MAG: HD domain-containing protein [Oscillospiraceae bacterium]|nr:HD domain-containing protein [Oscillospiraceae bacterium]
MGKDKKKEITYRDIRKNKEINALITQGNDVLRQLGYTEHSQRHAAKVAETAGEILVRLGYDGREVELAKIAGYLHDIGNSINRHDHAHTGALLAYPILKELGMPLKEVLTIVTAIGHHDEGTGTAVDVVSAALILADKTDVRRNRVQNLVLSEFDIHDRVNYAALASSLEIVPEEKVIRMNLELDNSICSVMDYFEIFLQRMILCKSAAAMLGYTFHLVVNGMR